MITDAQRYFYEANGYLCLPEVLSSSELTILRDAAHRTEARWRDNPSLRGHRGVLADEIAAPIEYEDALLNLLWHPGVFPLVRAILGDDVQYMDSQYIITPPRTERAHVGWHHDMNVAKIYHPLSTLWVKVFYLLTDVHSDSGGTVVLPGSHRFSADVPLPARMSDPKDTPGAVKLTGKAGDAYLFNGHIYHAATNNESDHPRHVLIYNYGHFWMKHAAGYAPSQRLLAAAAASGDPVRMQLLGICTSGDPYGQFLPR